MKDFMDVTKGILKTVVVVTVLKATVIGLCVMANTVLENYKKEA